MTRYLKVVMALIGCLFLLQCNKDDSLLFLTPRHSYDLVVEGGINTSLHSQYIRLTKPSFNPDSLPSPIDSATVIVNDGERNISFKRTQTPGVYSAVVNNNTNYNKPYKLIIHYHNKEYIAIDTLTQVINIIDDYLPLSATMNPAGNIAGTIPKHTFGYLYSSKWLISYRDIPLWNPGSFDGISYYNYTHSLGSPNSLYPLTDQNRSFELNPDENITIFKFSVSHQYAMYLYSLFSETEWKGIFSAVPTAIKGNISGNAQGYFYATDVDVRRYKAGELVR